MMLMKSSSTRPDFTLSVQRSGSRTAIPMSYPWSRPAEDDKDAVVANGQPEDVVQFSSLDGFVHEQSQHSIKRRDCTNGMCSPSTKLVDFSRKDKNLVNRSPQRPPGGVDLPGRAETKTFPAGRQPGEKPGQMLPAAREVPCALPGSLTVPPHATFSRTGTRQRTLVADRCHSGLHKATFSGRHALR